MEGRGIVVTVDFVGNGEFSDVLQIPFDISWADFELVLHLQFNCNELETKYVDDEGEQISLSSHEELQQAIEVAKKNNNTLQLKVFSKCACPNPNIHHDPEHHTEQCIVTDAVPVYPTGVKPIEKQRMNTCPEERESEEEERSSDSNGPEEKEGNSDDSGRPDRPIRYHGPDLVKRKKKKLDHFAFLAQDLGRLRKSYDIRPKRLHHETEQQRQDNANRVPPQWFTDYMIKFKQEIVSDVTNKVLKQGKVKDFVDRATGDEGASRGTGSSKEDEATYCHSGIVCDNCEQVIRGIRYKCGNCLDYDLCETCERSGIKHDDSHLFVKITRPVHGIGRTQSGNMKPILKKSVTDVSKSSNRKVLPAERKIMKIKKLEKKLTKTQQKLHALLPDPNEERQHYLDLDNVRQFRSPCFGKFSAKFVQDVTYPDGCHVYVGQKFTKCWTLRNDGEVAWPHNTKLKLLWGNLMCEHTEVATPSLEPGTEGTVSVELMAPPKPGTYQSHWRLFTSGSGYGHRLWCHVIVDELPPDTPEVSVQQPSTEQVEQVVQEENTADVACCEEPQELESSGESDDKSSLSGSTSGSVEADLLSAKNILSCENLEVEKRLTPNISQTATPTNTPQVATPPNERTPSSSDLSRRSSIEVIEPEDCQGEMTELVRRKISDLAIQTDVSGCLSRSSSASSLSTENDFYVVPLPECFNLEKPMSRSLMRTQSQSVEDVLSINSGDIYSAESNANRAETGTAMENTGVESQQQQQQQQQQPIVAELEQTQSQGGDSGAAANQEQEVEQNDLSGHFNDAAQENSDDENDEGCPEDEETELKIDLSGVAAAASSVDEDRDQPHSPTVIASNLASTVMGVTSKVANKAFTAAKDIFNHLQAQDEYVPPKSTWTPPQNTWTPTPSAWSPQAGQWHERQETDLTPMEKLIDMGFADRVKNQRLLDKHEDDVQKVLQDLLEGEVENDWHQIRH